MASGATARMAATTSGGISASGARQMEEGLVPPPRRLCCAQKWVGGSAGSTHRWPSNCSDQHRSVDILWTSLHQGERRRAIPYLHDRRVWWKLEDELGRL
jgi:hypothetical protein